MHLKKATQLDPKNADARYDLGKALLLEGDAAAAVLTLRQAAALKPESPEPHYLLARALEKIGDKEQSQHELQIFA